jgi:hypothetical protein
VARSITRAARAFGDGARPARVKLLVLTGWSAAMKRLMVAMALLASLGACMSWHPSNNGPARNTDDSRSYVAPVR